MELIDTDIPDAAETVIDQPSCAAQRYSHSETISPKSVRPRKNQRDYTQLGQDFSIALACMDAAERFKRVKTTSNGFTTVPDAGENDKSTPTRHTEYLATQLRTISAEIDTHRAQLLELLVQFDEQEGWAAAGARNCAEWANAHLGIARVSAYEFLRVGRELRDLPIIRALFRGGELSWSKVRLLARVADEDNERQLAHASLDATVADVERICREFRWKKLKLDDPVLENGQVVEHRSAEDVLAWRQFCNRAVTWREQPDGSTEIRITLPPEKAQAVLKSLEHCENELYEGLENNYNNETGSNAPSGTEMEAGRRPTPTQRRADALLLMSERSLNAAGASVNCADRYQVIMHVETKDLAANTDNPEENNMHVDTECAQSNSTCKHTHSHQCNHSNHHSNRHSAKHNPTQPLKAFAPLPQRRPWIEGAGPIARSVAQRITCDCSVVDMLLKEGEPLNIGRKTRIWPVAIERAIKTRDRHCQFPGCSEHRHLQIHHIVHWSDGGVTSVENGICLCHRHHALVHEGGYRIERVKLGQLQSRAKLLLPTRYRFRFVKPGKPDVQDQYPNGCREHPALYCVTAPVL